MQRSTPFKFRHNDVIGVAEAENDERFLRDCFVDTGDLDVLRQMDGPQHIVLGRTGTGKSALLTMLRESEERAIFVKPESLALAHISNSTILAFLAQLGVNLDVFFKLLWRHVLTIEILKRHFPDLANRQRPGFFEAIRDAVARDPGKARAVNYMRNWGEKFWQDTDDRIAGVTEKFEADVKARVGIKTPVDASIEGVQKLTEERKREIKERAQTVVNEVQIKELSEILEVLDTILDDPQKRYFIVIDRLDDTWVEDRVRYLLIRALIETVRDFRGVRHAKVVLAMRVDLIERVYRLTRGPGFQQEKFEDLNLRLRWSREQLAEVLDRRIARLVKSRYTTHTVTHTDVLPKTVATQPTIDYLLDRTFLRPRDIILFFNYIIANAPEGPRLSVQAIKDGEGEYSRARLASIGDEWRDDYPNLLRFAEILRGRRSDFRLADISEQECGDYCIERVIEGFEVQDELSIAANRVVDAETTLAEFRQTLLLVLFKVGLLGFKVESYEKPLWAFERQRPLQRDELRPPVKVHVHKSIWRALQITDQKGR